MGHNQNYYKVAKFDNFDPDQPTGDPVAVVVVKSLDEVVAEAVKAFEGNMPIIIPGDGWAKSGVEFQNRSMIIIERGDLQNDETYVPSKNAWFVTPFVG